MITKKIVVITASILLVMVIVYLSGRALNNFFYPGDQNHQVEYDGSDEQIDREVDLVSDSESLDQEEQNDQVEESAEEAIVYREEIWGYTTKAEYLGNQVWQYQITGELPNRCYDYDYQLIKTGNDPEEPVGDFDRVDLELVVLIPNEVCEDRTAEPVSIEGRYQAPAETAFVFLVDVPVEPIVKIDSGFTIRARYVDRERWRYQLEGELPNDCWEFESKLTVDDHDKPESVELSLRLVEPDSAVACQSPWSISEEGQYVAGPKAGLHFTVIEELLVESDEENDHSSEDNDEGADNDHESDQ